MTKFPIEVGIISLQAARYKIALNLAYAVLLFHGSPWLRDSWTLGDISLLLQNKLPSFESYLPRLFGHGSSNAPTTQSELRAYVPHEGIYSLGIALLELSLGSLVISFQKSDELQPPGQVSIFTEFLVANRLAKEIAARELTPYADAINRCIRCNFGTQSTNLEDIELQALFYEGVITPLKELYKLTLSSSTAT